MHDERKQDRPWPVAKSPSPALGYEDPLRLRRWPMSAAIRPSARTTSVSGQAATGKVSAFESS